MNIENAKQEFLRYSQRYDLTFPKMKKKFDHSFRVMEIAEKIAESLNLSDEQINIAKLIGLIHDIGYFEVIKVNYILKEDKKIDHGDFGVEILEKDDYIRKYIEENEYNKIILTAIKNHNKFKIEEGLSKEELLFAKIIRDADKLDIFYEGAELFWTQYEQQEEINNSKISDQAIDIFSKYIHQDRKDVKTKADSIINFIALIFDINFKYDFEVIKRENYIDRILNKFNFKDVDTLKKIQQIRKIASDYINGRII